MGRLTRIYTEQPLASGSQVVLEKESSHHLTQVLRLRRDSEIQLFDGSGRAFSAKLMSARNRHIQLEVLNQSDEEPEPQNSIHLGLGISKGERMDFAIQKSVELGVTTITPLVTERTVVRLPEKRWRKRHAHWRNIVISACEQSGRNRLPVVNAPTSLTAWLPMLGKALSILLAQDSSLRLKDLPPPVGAINLLTGPEGGLSAEEKRQANQSGYIDVSLGPRTMRTETAPLAAIAAIQTLWGDF